jgi:hypothetical protein
LTIPIIRLASFQSVGVEKTINLLPRGISVQIVPLRPYIHKVYLLVDLLLSPLWAWFMAAYVAIGQLPGNISSAGLPLLPFCVNKLKYCPAVLPGSFLNLLCCMLRANGDVLLAFYSGNALINALCSLWYVSYLFQLSPTNRVSRSSAAMEASVEVCPNLAYATEKYFYR